MSRQSSYQAFILMVAADWMMEETVELASSTSADDQVDALLDAFGVLYAALDSVGVERRTRVFERYLATQTARGRSVDVPHVAALRALIERLDSSLDLASHSREMITMRHRRGHVGRGFMRARAYLATPESATAGMQLDPDAPFIRRADKE